MVECAGTEQALRVDGTPSAVEVESIAMVNIPMKDCGFVGGRSLQQLPCDGCRSVNVVCAKPYSFRLDQVVKPEGQGNNVGRSR